MLVKIGILIYGYFAGALIQAGYWMGKVNKIDIRDYGSGNAGTTNVMRTLGKKAGIATCLLYTSPSPRDGATSRMPSSA